MSLIRSDGHGRKGCPAVRQELCPCPFAVYVKHCSSLRRRSPFIIRMGHSHGNIRTGPEPAASPDINRHVRICRRNTQVGRQSHNVRKFCLNCTEVFAFLFIGHRINGQNRGCLVLQFLVPEVPLIIYRLIPCIIYVHFHPAAVRRVNLFLSHTALRRFCVQGKRDFHVLILNLNGSLLRNLIFIFPHIYGVLIGTALIQAFEGYFIFVRL